MMQSQVMEGTGKEIGILLQREPFAGLKLRVTIDEEQEDLDAGIPTPPFTVRDQAHLDELLLAGLNSPMHIVTDESWEQRRAEVYQRLGVRPS